ncbi:MAG: ATP-binding cassette domain-containing protein [Planctomycetota bacterium]
MALIGLNGVTLAHGGPPLLDGIGLQIEDGERLGLLGRNASGKSTLMGVLTGEVAIDDGEVTRRQGVTVARLPQEVPRGLAGTVRALVAAAVPPREEAWRTRARLDQLFEGLRLDPDADVARLSAGLSRRVLLAKALASDPDLLLLDEPTNHLDVPSIQWLEEHLLEREKATLFVTHDRAFLRRLATRILELDRGRLTSWPGDYENYLRRQQERADDEAARRVAADKLLAKEEAWRRTNVKAQRNRNQSRVEALEKLRAERRDRRDPTGTVRMGISEAERSGRIVFEATGLTAGHGATAVVKALDLGVMRGDRLGLVGPNGTGKTTLLRTLLGELPPLAGHVRRGTNLEVVWYDPLNAALDPDKSVRDSVADGADQLDIDGKRRHVVSYLADFLFASDRAHQPVRLLSGGERARLLLARLFAKASNVLVLDEPTNDLDAETMDVLEDVLLAYQGTVLVVSHDRDFLDQVVTGLLVFEGNGRVREVVGGWTEWQRIQRKERAGAKAADAKPADARPGGKPAAPAPKAAPKDRRELERVEKKIATLEDEQRRLHAAMEDPAFWSGPADRIETTQARLAALAPELEAAYARWTELGG